MLSALWKWITLKKYICLVFKLNMVYSFFQEGEDPPPAIEHSECPKCGMDVVKERPHPSECINCWGVFGANTLFELEFDMQARKSTAICSICRGPLKIAQKERQPKRVLPLGMRLDIKRDPSFQEMFSKWDARDGAFQKGDAPPLDLSKIYRSIYRKDFSEVYDVDYVRVKPPRATIPPRPPFDKPTTFKVDYQWRGKGAKPGHPRTVCQELNHVSWIWQLVLVLNKVRALAKLYTCLETVLFLTHFLPNELWDKKLQESRWNV